MFHNRSILTKLLGLAALLLMVPALWPQADDADPAVPEGVEVLARGPVHEAFAEPASSKAKPAPAVPKPPPEAIDEVPPDQKPEGNVQWLPGYWSWDEERNDYLWVSGFWRVPPPGRQWVPGHWKQVAGGWQWTAGFWAAQDQKELTYLPPPPEPIEAGTVGAGAVGGACLCPRQLGLSRRPLRLAARLLGRGPARLGLGTLTLCVDQRRLCLCRWLLGLHVARPRPALRAGLYRCGSHPPARLVLHAHLCDPRRLPGRRSLCPARL